MSTKESYPHVRTAIGSFSQENGDNIITVVHNNPLVTRLAFPEVKEPGKVNGYLKKLLIMCDVPNLPLIDLPTVEITTSRSEAYMLQKQTEWHSPGFGILLWATKHPNPRPEPGYGDWTLKGYHSVINTGVWRQYDSYPVFSNNLASELEENDRIGISLVSRWNNQIEYFPRFTPPYVLPDNRPDTITYDVAWVQDLVIAKQDTRPLFITVYSSGSSTPQTQPPLVAITSLGQPVTGELYTFNKTPMSLSISQLTPSAPFSYQWYLAGNPIGSLTNDTADGTGAKVFNFDSSVFVSPPFIGTGSYSLRVTNGALSTDSNAVTIKHFKPQSRLNPLPVSSALSGTGTTWTTYIYDYADNKPVTLTMMKNGVDLVGWTYTGTPAFYSGTIPSPWQLTGIPSNIFYQTGWGVGTGENYQIKAVSNGVTSISDPFLVTQYVSGGKG